MIKKYKHLFFPILVLVAVLSSGLGFFLQFKINKFDREIANLQSEIKKTDVEIKVLKTEISHLTSIQRVREIANRYLPQYKNITQKDFINLMDIPVNPDFE